MISKCGKRGLRLSAAFIILTVTIGGMAGCGQEEDLPVALAERGQAVSYIGEGYSIILPDNDWVTAAPDSWHAVENEQVRFWIGNYAGLDKGQVERILMDQGYQADEGDLWKQENDTLYRVQCVETKQDVWTLNSVISPSGTHEDWEEALQDIFDTFAVAEGYDVGAVTPQAVMPEGEKLQLSEGIYSDETSRVWVLQDPDYAGNYIYNELIICNVTDCTFDFEVVRRNYETDERELIIPQGTAYINEDGISAVYMGEGYTLTFDFSDGANPLPVVFYIKVWGAAELEGIGFLNSDVPGYDAG